MLALGIGYPLGALGSAFVARSASTSLGMSIAFALVLLVWPSLHLAREREPEHV
jgi:hypothetical protein